MKLVHHPVHSTGRELSPFAMQIHAIADGSNLRIACPYLGLHVLRPILAKAKRWRLLTDAEELLRSHARRQRDEWIDFLAKHEAFIRHWPGLHAKVVAGDEAALVSSANLTEAGFAERQEMGVLLNDKVLVEELHAWFDGLWSQCAPVVRTDLENFARSLPRNPPDIGVVGLPSSVSRVSAIAVPDVDVEVTDNEERFAMRLATGVSRTWVDAYLDMCRDLLVTLNISEDDIRLSMSVRPSGDALPVMINQRYVLCAFHHGSTVVGMMLPRGFEVPAEFVPSMNAVRDHLGSFKAWCDEESEDVPQFGYFEVDDPRALFPMRDAWLDAVRKELRRPWKKSSFRRYHVPAFFCAVVDVEHRARMLDRVFADALASA
jgi:hypothetical protein